MKQLPRWVEWLLKAICPDELFEQIEGDLIEVYHYEVKSMGERKAKWRFIITSLRFFRPGIILRNKFSVQLITISMFSNYIRVAFRNLLRSKGYSFITISGLAIGIACSFTILIFVHGEWSYNKGFDNANRIYRIGISFFNMGPFAVGPERLLEVLPKEFAGIETATRIRKESGMTIKLKDQEFNETVYFTDTAYFKIFNYTFVGGHANEVLAAPNEAVISESLAQKFFGHTDVIGETIEVGKDKTLYTIKGVVENLKFNTQLKTELWLSIQSKLTSEPVWSSAAYYNYVLLRAHNSEIDLRQALNSIFENYVFPESGKPMGFKTIEDYKANDLAIKFFVDPLPDIYLKSKLNFDISPGGNESNVYIFSIVSFSILLLAGVNFINLATARAARRAKEVGVRKSMGTARHHLMTQFLLESIISSSIAMLLALVLLQGFLLVFEYITGFPLLTTSVNNLSTVGLLMGFSLIVGLLAGLYPAFYLTSFNPTSVLKGEIKLAGGAFRNALVVFQFSVSILLIICTTTVQRQLRYMQTKDLGFDQENVLTIDNASLLKNSADAFKEELSKQTGVLLSSFHAGEPGSQRIMTFSTYQTSTSDHPISINTYFGDADYIALNGMKLIKGRGFDKNLASDTASIILNEEAVKVLNLGADPIGTVINENQKIIGIVSDFHWESLRNNIAPLAIALDYKKMELGFKLKGESVASFLKIAEEKWKQIVPDEPFNYHFLDDNFSALLKKEAVFSKLIMLFTILAVFISCLGLYGLSAFTAEQRTKEIGIRKVLGATTSGIVLMLNKKFSLLIIAAVVISIPLSVYIIQKWLEGFAYHVDLEVSIYFIAISITFLIAWVAVSFHSLKASTINPSQTLKYE